MLTTQRTKSRVTKSRVTMALTAIVLAALAATPVPMSASAPAGPPKVCGTLTPDEAYQAEVGVIGTDHACEHLKGRKWNKAPRAHSGATSRVASGVASAAVDAPEEVGSWSTAVNPGTKTVGISLGALPHRQGADAWRQVPLHGQEHGGLSLRPGYQDRPRGAGASGGVLRRHHISQRRADAFGRRRGPGPQGHSRPVALRRGRRGVDATARLSAGSVLPHVDQVGGRPHSDRRRKSAERYDEESQCRDLHAPRPRRRRWARSRSSVRHT